eukprot:gene10871-12867_t
MAQVRLVYPWYHGGSSFAWLFSASEVTRFECISWLPLSCVWDELTSGSHAGERPGFLLRFVFFAWLPFILAIPMLYSRMSGDGQPVTLDESHMSVALSIPINLKSPTLAEVRPPLHYDTSEPLAFLAVTLFCMVMMHPTISSSMFQIFQCDEIYHDNTTVQYFLSVDISFECFTSKWYFCAAVACFVIIVYVFGAPYFLYLTISRCYQMKEFTVNGRIQYVNWWEVEVKEDGYYTLLNQERLLIHPIYIDLNGPFVPTNIRSELDNCSWGRILWPMTNSYKRSLIFWEPYEILRNAVMVAQLIVGEGIDIVFNIIIAVVAITIQGASLSLIYDCAA